MRAVFIVWPDRPKLPGDDAEAAPEAPRVRRRVSRKDDVLGSPALPPALRPGVRSVARSSMLTIMVVMI